MGLYKSCCIYCNVYHTTTKKPVWWRFNSFISVLIRFREYKSKAFVNVLEEGNGNKTSLYKLYSIRNQFKQHTLSFLILLKVLNMRKIIFLLFNAFLNVVFVFHTYIEIRIRTGRAKALFSNRNLCWNVNLSHLGKSSYILSFQLK